MITVDFDTVAQWLKERTDCVIPREGQGVGWLNGNGDLVAGVMYETFTGSSITATIAIEPETIVSPKFIRAIFYYPFVQLSCKKIIAHVNEHNIRSRRLVERMGFTQEAAIEDFYENGAVIVYSVTAEQCRYLEKEYVKNSQDCTNS